jgi:hypothetical protein
MVAEGMLPDFTGNSDVVERELAKLEGKDNVERELLALKQEVRSARGELPPGRGQEDEQ